MPVTSPHAARNVSPSTAVVWPYRLTSLPISTAGVCGTVLTDASLRRLRSARRDRGHLRFAVADRQDPREAMPIDAVGHALGLHHLAEHRVPDPRGRPGHQVRPYRRARYAAHDGRLARRPRTRTFGRPRVWNGLGRTAHGPGPRTQPAHRRARRGAWPAEGLRGGG